MTCICPIAQYCETHKRDMTPFDGLRWKQCRNEPGYYEAFQKGLPPVPIDNLIGPNQGGECVRRGEKIEDRQCDTCGNRGTIQPVYQCSLYGECSEWEKFKTVKSCRWCQEFLQKPPVSSNDFKTFEKVYCVNLDRRPDRWGRFVENLESIGTWSLPTVERWTATDGWRPETPEWWNAGGGAWGCFDSHRRILRHCVDNRIESVLIFEDDALFQSNFNEQLKQFLEAVPDDWEMLYLGGQHQHEWQHKPKRVKDGVLRPHNVNRTHAYAYRGTGITKALEFLEDFEQWREHPSEHIDHRLGRLHETQKIIVYSPDAWLVGQAANSSDIDGKSHGNRTWESGKYRKLPPLPVVPKGGRIRVGVLYPNIAMGGAEVWLKTLLKNLDQSRFEVVGVGVDDPPSPNAILPPCPLTQDFRSLAQSVDVTIAWTVKNPRQFSFYFKGPIISMNHGGNTDWCKKIVAPFKDIAHAFVGVSSESIGAFPERIQPQVRVISNGVEPPVLIDRDEARERLGIEDRLAVGYVGRFEGEKDPFAAARAVHDIPNAVAVYHGSALWWNEDDFKRDVNTLTGGRAIFLSPERPVGITYSALDCLCLTSPSEGFGNVAVEAWFSKVPVVGTPTGVMRDNQDAIVEVEIGANEAAMSKAVLEAVERERVQLAYDRAVERYNVARMVREWEDLIVEVLESQKTQEVKKKKSYKPGEKRPKLVTL